MIVFMKTSRHSEVENRTLTFMQYPYLFSDEKPTQAVRGDAPAGRISHAAASAPGGRDAPYSRRLSPLSRMLPPRCARLFLICLLALWVTGCAAPHLRVVNEPEFAVMAERIGPTLRAHGILDENNAYTAPLFGGQPPSDPGARLFARLSPAFRFKVDPALLPATFAQSRGPGDSVIFRPDGFVMDRNGERVTVALLAVVDRHGNGQEEWLLLCRVSTPRVTELLDYYLLAEQPDASILRPRVLAVRDCRARRCGIFGTGPGAREPVPEAPVIDVEAGAQPVTLPPGADSPSRSADRPGLSERPLGG